MTKRFTGWHMTGILVGFFGVVIAVNTVMATEAVRTFGGAVVENSYVASQRYDAWLAAARAQQRLGWRADARVGADGRLVLAVAAPAGALVRVVADHPLGRQPSRSFTMRAEGPGRYVSAEPVGAGRWLLRVEIAANGQVARFEDEVGR